MIPFIIIYHHKGAQLGATQSVAFKHSTFPPGPPSVRILNDGPQVAHFKGSWDLAWANMGQIRLKIALDNLFEHPRRSRNGFGKLFDHFWTHR